MILIWNICISFRNLTTVVPLALFLTLLTALTIPLRIEIRELGSSAGS